MLKIVFYKMAPLTIAATLFSVLSFTECLQMNQYLF